ncbi:MAG: hypothetical protein ACHP7E_05945, partial [Burkholderiales bacterium]
MATLTSPPAAQRASITTQQAYDDLQACTDDVDRIASTARLILAVFDDFYARFSEYPYLAKRAFETMDPLASIRLSKERLGLWSAYIAEHGP